VVDAPSLLVSAAAPVTPKCASSSPTFRISWSNHVRVIEHLLDAHPTGQSMCYGSGQVIGPDTNPPKSAGSAP